MVCPCRQFCPVNMKWSLGIRLCFLLAVQWGVLLVPSHSSLQNEGKIRPAIPNPSPLPLSLSLSAFCASFLDSGLPMLHISAASALAAFKRQVFEDPSSVLSDWNVTDGSPCNWTGVTCSRNQDAVLSLNLSGLSLRGFIPSEFVLLTSLQELYLNGNLLLGTIPKQIGMLKNLTILNLSVNRFTGPIPVELGDLLSVNKIDLHSNGLSGYIPAELGKLRNLVELRLDRNRLKGPIAGSNNLSFSPASQAISTSINNGTGLCRLPRLRIAEFSYNFFTGKIPPCLKYLPRTSFQGNCFEDKYSILQRTSQICNGGHSKSQGAHLKTYKRSNEANKEQKLQQPKWLLILEVITGVLVVVCGVIGTVTAVKSCRLMTSAIMPWKKSPGWKDEMSISIDGELLKNVQRFTREELEVACEDFSNIIGSSSDSVVYKGTMKNGPEVAVISLCILEDHWASYLEFIFQTKVADLSRLNHENVAKLLGYCKESDPFSRMLIFDYASNGTLYEHLHYGEASQLSWHRRMKIILGIARALRFLHIDLQPSYAICQLNSSAVYLTEDFSPKLVDFESWRATIPKSEKNSGYITNGGHLHGYMDAQEQLDMDIQGNIFSFGVILLELISGRPSYCKDRGYLVDWAMGYLQQPEEISKLLDPELKNVKQDDLALICSVASLCIEPDPSKRPSMQIISAVLENGINLSPESNLAWAELALST